MTEYLVNLFLLLAVLVPWVFLLSIGAAISDRVTRRRTRRHRK